MSGKLQPRARHSNCIRIVDPPNEMFGKLMSISDELMWHYYELLTDLPMHEIRKLMEDVATGTLHPKQAKISLAKLIVTDFHSLQAADEAETAFAASIQHGPNPTRTVTVETQLSGVKVDGTLLESPTWSKLVAVLEGCSTSHATRLIRDRAIKLRLGHVERTINEPLVAIELEDGMVIQVGRRTAYLIGISKGELE